MKDVIILIIAVLAGAAWGWLIKEVFNDRRSTVKVPVTPERLNNLLLAAILGLMVGWFILHITGCSIDVEDAYSLQAPEKRCEGLTLEACLARVTVPDGGVD